MSEDHAGKVGPLENLADLLRECETEPARTPVVTDQHILRAMLGKPWGLPEGFPSKVVRKTADESDDDIARGDGTMKQILRRATLALIVVLAVALWIVPASASTTQGGLELRKSKYVMDDRGQVWLSVQLVNNTSNALSIIGLAPGKAGPWTSVGQTATPGAMVRSAMKVKEDGVTALWVDTTQGILRFDLPHPR
jgi:hypothetical protein